MSDPYRHDTDTSFFFLVPRSGSGAVKDILGKMSALFGHVYRGGDPGWTWSGCSFASVGRRRKRRRRIITTTLRVTTESTYREEYNNMSMLTLQTRLAYSARQVWD
jgi:hypothetical protein